MDRDNLPRTEAVNPLTAGIDTWPALRIAQAISAEDHRVAPAVAREVRQIARAAELAAAAITGGNRVFYAGSGTSGRLGVLDASEIEPTFGVDGRLFTALMAGGREAFFKPIEGAEDSVAAGRDAVLAQNAGPGDVVIGIAASGSTPFVMGALDAAKEKGAFAVAVVGDPGGAVAQSADLVISPDVGPEVVAGSTRMKNGTAQKMILNMISTTAMILAGRTYSNLMAGVTPRNRKLSGRARRILVEATGKSPSEVEDAFNKCGGDVSLALVSLRRGVGPEDASRLLESTGGAIRAAADGNLSLTELHQAPATSTASAAAVPSAAAIPTATHTRSAALFPSTGRPQVRYGSPEEAGLDESQVEKAFTVVRDCVGDGEGEVPGAVAAIVHQGIVVGPRAYGWAVRNPVRIPMTPFTVFDMASLTKVVATTPSVLICCERGLFRLDDTVATFIPEFGAGGKETITLRHLLTHTSGLPAHVKFWEKGLLGEHIFESICAMELPGGSEPGTKVVYSDLGFITLAEVVKRVTGDPIDRFAAREVFTPLGMSETRFLPPGEWQNRIAATEYRTDLGKVMWGEVHDENAHALGGVAGHAGLFSTAEDVARYALMWLGCGQGQGARVLSEAAVAAAISEETNAGERRGLGWMLRAPQFSSGGDFFSNRAYGHTGFTGTSLWCDPETGTAAILLTNRVHAGRDGRAIIRLRPRFHNAVAAAVRHSGKE
ncbi:MAG: N-acetylmuramic acid 6-phosphate etherase [Bacillota bacterium]